MQVECTELPEVLLVKPRVFGDDRGYFLETWNQARYAEAGIEVAFVQSNVSRSARGVLRGLHYQYPNPQGKLVHVLEGEVYDVAVDIRRASPTRGRWVGLTLSARDHHQLYIPPGFAHGFCVLSEHATFCYLCSTPYDGQADAGIRWDDPAIGVRWPVRDPVLSEKDQRAPLLSEVPASRLPE